MRSNEFLLNSFLRSKELEGRTAKTIAFYKTAIELVFFRSPAIPIATCTTSDIRDRFSKLTCGPVGLDGYRRALSSFFRFLFEEELIDKNPMARIHRIKQPKIIKQPFSRAEIGTMREKFSLKSRAIIELLISSGIRISECVQLNFSDLDFEKLTFIVFGKGQKERRCFFSRKAANLLLEYKSAREALGKFSNVLFLPDHVYKNRPFERLTISGIEGRLKKEGAKNGIKGVYPHRFRRTFATWALSAGVPVDQIRILLGHENIQTTLRYALTEQEQVLNSYRSIIEKSL